MITPTDILIIGGGIAGAGAAYQLSEFASVVVLEREPQCGYHSTGRSAASYTENYGNVLIRRLVLGSRPFLESPPSGFCEHSLLLPRGMVTIARPGHQDDLERQFELAHALVPSIVRISPADALARVPILKPAEVTGAFWEPDCMDLDVGGLHQGFLRAAKGRGATVRAGADVVGVTRRGGQWHVETTSGEFRAPVLVNAAGAWADALASLAGVPPLGLVPRRRTAFHIAPPPGMDVRAWPMVDDAGGGFYFKPDAGRLFISPADATPSPPVDAQPEDLDVALGVERFEHATTLEVSRVLNAWAGLRTFAPDSSPVVGPDAAADGFIWLAGQGGYGIKTSPALSRICAALLRGQGIPADLARLGITEEELSPDRFRQPVLRPAAPALRTAELSPHT